MMRVYCILKSVVCIQHLIWDSCCLAQIYIYLCLLYFSSISGKGFPSNTALYWFEIDLLVHKTSVKNQWNQCVCVCVCVCVCATWYQIPKPCSGLCWRCPGVLRDQSAIHNMLARTDGLLHWSKLEVNTSCTPGVQLFMSDAAVVTAGIKPNLTNHLHHNNGTAYQGLLTPPVIHLSWP